MPTFASYDGTEIYYREVGDGAPLVCLPGGPARAGVYLGDLGGLSRHRRLIVPDQRGSGNSADPADPATLRVDRLVEDVEALRVHLGLERMDLLAHSAGAVLATMYAAARPAADAIILGDRSVEDRCRRGPYLVGPGDTEGQVVRVGFSLTWLSDNKTLAVGIATTDAKAGPTAAVRYLNTASPGSSLAEASRTVTLSFPANKAKAGTPDGRYGTPVATSDGQRVLCSGVATHPVNAGGTTEVGIWVFSGRTGALTAAWNEHTICCARSGTAFPRILWVSPHGTLLIASGMTTDNQGAQLFLRAADGSLQQLPWKGLTRRPGQASIVEPSIAW